MNIFFYFSLGTLHCGKNTPPLIPSQLGYFNNLDNCCKRHDSCPFSIEPGMYREMQIEGNVVRKYRNKGSFTVSLCHCDEAFMNCLNDIGFAGRLLYNFYREVMSAECIIYESQFKLKKGVMPILSPIERDTRFMEVFSEEATIS